MNQENRRDVSLKTLPCLKKSVAALLLVLGSGATAANWPTLSVKPDLFAPGVNLTQSASAVTLKALTSQVPYVVAVGNSAYGDNYKISANLVFDSTSLTELGLVARADTSTLSLYELSLNPVNKYLTLVEITNGTTFANLDAFQFTDFNINTTYTLSLDVNGSSLTGYLYNGSTLVKKLEATDSSLATGQLGIFVFKPTGGGSLISGTWDNPTLTVPEPASLVLLIGAGLALLGGGKRLASFC